MPDWNIIVDNPEDKRPKTETLGTLIWHLRNAAAHGRLEFADNPDSPECQQSTRPRGPLYLRRLHSGTTPQSQRTRTLQECSNPAKPSETRCETCAEKHRVGRRRSEEKAAQQRGQASGQASCRFSGTIDHRFSRSLTHPLGAVIKTCIRFQLRGQSPPLSPRSFRWGDSFSR